MIGGRYGNDPAEAPDPIECEHCGDSIRYDTRRCDGCGAPEGTAFPCGDESCEPCWERLECAKRTGKPCPGRCGVQGPRHVRAMRL